MLLFEVWDLLGASGFQIELAKEFMDVYMMSNMYIFTFDPHVHDLFQMHSSMVHVMDSLYDSIPCAKFGSNQDQCYELPPLETLTPVTPNGGDELIQQVQLDVSGLQESFVDSRDIVQLFTWDPGGGVYLSSRLLGDKQFQEGRTVMSPFC